MKILLFVITLAYSSNCTYVGWSEAKKRGDKLDLSAEKEVEESPSNLGCFLCTQLLSVTKHRVGLSQAQLRESLNEKCSIFPSSFKKQCNSFVEKSLPEIYFSLNYDFSTKDICIRLNLCNETNPFAIGGPVPAPTDHVTTHLPRDTVTTHLEMRPSETRDRIGYRNSQKETEKRITCSFCERMLENAKNYAVIAKKSLDNFFQADIGDFANSACGKLEKGPLSDSCYELADKKIAELAKFVDGQVVEALWCAELNQC